MVDDDKKIECKLCGEHYLRGEMTLYGVCQDCYADFDSLDLEDQLAFLLRDRCANCED